MNRKGETPIIALSLRSIIGNPALSFPAGVAVLLLSSLYCVLPLLIQKSIPLGHDTGFHIFQSFQFLQGLENGSLYPRWAADANNGYGSPNFIFYSPLTYYLMSFIHRWEPSMIMSMVWVIWAGFFLSGLSVFFATGSEPELRGLDPDPPCHGVHLFGCRRGLSPVRHGFSGREKGTYQESGLACCRVGNFSCLFGAGCPGTEICPYRGVVEIYIYLCRNISVRFPGPFVRSLLSLPVHHGPLGNGFLPVDLPCVPEIVVDGFACRYELFPDFRIHRRLFSHDASLRSGMASDPPVSFSPVPLAMDHRSGVI